MQWNLDINIIIMDSGEIEKIGDYSIALLSEINFDIEQISESSNISEANLSHITQKLEKAEESGVNIDSLKKQVLEFRYIIFKRNIDNKIEKIKEDLNTFALNIDDISKEYDKLLKEKLIDKEELKRQFNILKDFISIARIKIMIKNIRESESSPIYTIDQVINELHLLKEKNIDVSELEVMLFE